MIRIYVEIKLEFFFLSLLYYYMNIFFKNLFIIIYYNICIRVIYISVCVCIVKIFLRD